MPHKTAIDKAIQDVRLEDLLAERAAVIRSGWDDAAQALRDEVKPRVAELTSMILAIAKAMKDGRVAKEMKGPEFDMLADWLQHSDSRVALRS